MMLIFHYLTFSLLLFVIGLWGMILNRKNVITILMALEVLLLSANVNFIIFSVYLDDIRGQIFSLLILVIAAAESAIGLAILVIFYKKHQTIEFDFIYGLHG